MKQQKIITGAGLGLRRDFLDEYDALDQSDVDFMEVAPENWIPYGGRLQEQFRRYTDRFPFVIHGLSLSIGGPTPLDTDFVKQVAEFIKTYDIQCYSEHLSYCSDDGHMYDLMPIPFTEEAVHYVAARIKQVQDIIGQQIAMENVSYYAAPGQEMSELEFLLAVLEEADCKLLLDVNNIYVNSINHQYDAEQFLKALPKHRIAYGHIAGHYDEADDLKVDTHGSDVKTQVWDLLDLAYEQFGVFPTLLERDFNIPKMSQLLKEVEQIKVLQNKYQQAPAAIA
ncbi:HvfB family MNIO-type RiPP peptide maturase [Kangiella sp. M94]